MTSHDEHENLTVKMFFEEYGMVVFFGSFFLMTMFLPLLFLPPEYSGWFVGGICGVVGVITLLVVMMVLAGRSKKA